MLKSIYFHHTKSTKTHTARNKKQGKTGIFCKKTDILTKIHTTCARIHLRFSKHLRPTRPKFPYKNNREFFRPQQGFPIEYQGKLKIYITTPKYYARITLK